MNLFAHLLIALERRDEPAWLVGSMAPDLAHMAGLRIASAGEGPLGDGVRFHHESDEAFHGAPAFVALMKAGRADCQRRGLALGPSLAIGHVGVELLLDGCLAERGVPADYERAVAAAGPAGTEALTFRGEAQAPLHVRWLEVCERLASAPIPSGYADPAFVAERLVRILARRPRLAVAPERADAVLGWCVDWRPRVAAEVEGLLGEVRERLAD